MWDKKRRSMPLLPKDRKSLVLFFFSSFGCLTIFPCHADIAPHSYRRNALFANITYALYWHIYPYADITHVSYRRAYPRADIAHA